MRAARLGTAALLAAGGAGAALGQNAAADPSAPVTGAAPSTEAATLPAVRVTAPGSPGDGSADRGYRSDRVSGVGPWQGRALQDTPYSISVVPDELIRNVQATTPDAIYRILPSVEMMRPQRDNDQPGIYMRGFYIGTAFRDGLPADQYGHATTVEDVDRVEVFSGLSGFLYGPGNVGGMINYISKRPTAEGLNRVTLGVDGGSSAYALGDFGGPIDGQGRFGYRINAAGQDGDTSIEGQRIRKRFVSAAFDWHVSDRLLWQFDLGRRDYKVLGGQASWYMAPGVARPSAGFADPSVSWNQPWSSRHYETFRYATRVAWQPTDTLSLRAAYSHNWSRRNTGFGSNTIQSNGTYNQSIGDIYAPGDEPMRSEQFDRRAHAFADLAFATGRVQHKLTVGAILQKSIQERYTKYSPNINFNGLPLTAPTDEPQPIQVHVDRGARGRVIDYTYTTALVGDDIRFDEHWSLLAGVARSTIDSAPITLQWAADGYRRSAWTPNLSLVYKPVEAVTTYLSYIESLEQGGAATDTYNGYNVVNAGEVMQPLISKQLELGAKADVGGLLLAAALFEIDKGLQYYDLTTPTAPRYVQDGLQVHRGIEFSAVGKATPDLTLSGGFTWLDPMVKDQKQNPALEGKKPTEVASAQAKLWAEYRIGALPGLFVNGGVSWIGSRWGDTMNTDALPGYALLDAGARYEARAAGRPLVFRVSVANVTGKRYWANSYTLGEPRTVRLSVSAQF